MLLLELFILYNMIYFLTVEYEISENKLIINSFLFRKKIFYLKDILQIKDEGGYYLFRKIPFGINAIILNFKNGKDLTIIVLNDHFSFIQNLRSNKR